MGHEVTLVSDEEIGYSRCGLPYLVSGRVRDPEELIEIPSSSLMAMGGELLYPAQAVKLNLNEGNIEVNWRGDRLTLSYEYLVLATGAKPVIPNLPGVDLEGVYYLRTLRDALLILKRLRSAGRAAIIGANFTGVEMAEAFLERGLEVALIDSMDRPLWRALDPDISKHLTRRMRAEARLSLNLGVGVSSIVGRSEVEGVLLEDGRLIEADIVLLGTGAVPNSDLAAEAGLRIGRTGGIVVDEMLRAREGIYAIGDCIEVRNLASGLPTVVQLSPAAQRQAWVAAMNISGRAVKYPGDLPVGFTRFIDLYIGVAGYSEMQASKEGLRPRSKRVTSRLRSPFMDGGGKAYLKLVFDDRGRLIGGQVLGPDPHYVAERTNLVAALIQMGAGVEEVALLRSGYAPPMSDLVDPFMKIGWMVMERWS